MLTPKKERNMMPGADHSTFSTPVPDLFSLYSEIIMIEVKKNRPGTQAVIYNINTALCI